MSAPITTFSFNPNRPLVGLPKPATPAPAQPKAPTPAAPKPAAPAPAQPKASTPAQQSRLQEQEQIAQGMLSNLGSDAHIAAIMAVPVMGQQAMAISMAASARALSRYETEVPQQDFNTIYNQEMGTARQRILALPGEYGQTISSAATATGNGIVSGFKAVGDFFEDIGEAIVHGFGAILKGIGYGLEDAGKALDPSNG